MSHTILALPVSLEQLGAAIRRMSREDQRKLLDLAPSLREVAWQTPEWTESQARETVSHLQQEILAELGGKPLAPDELFLGDMTLSEYHALSEQEKHALWEAWADIDLMTLEEREVLPNAVLA